MDDLLLEFMRHYGIKEIAGPEANPEILDFFKEIGFDWVESDETAWCSAAMNYFCMKLHYERSGKLDARSWLKVGTRIDVPFMGCVVVFWRNKISSWEGHVALYVSDNGDSIYCLGGNQGDGFFISSYPKNRVLSYRKLSKL